MSAEAVRWGLPRLAVALCVVLELRVPPASSRSNKVSNLKSLNEAPQYPLNTLKRLPLEELSEPLGWVHGLRIATELTSLDTSDGRFFPNGTAHFKMTLKSNDGGQ